MKRQISKTWTCWIGAGVFFYCQPAIAQLTLPPPHPQNVANFQQNLDIYDWQYLLGWRAANKFLTYALGVDLRASMQKQLGRNKWKDNQTGFLMLQRDLSAKTSLLARLQQTNFRDELSSFNYDRNQSAVTLAGKWKASYLVQLQPEIGYRWENRDGFLETGPYVAFSLNATNIDWSGYKNSLAGWSELTRFPERHNAEARIQYTVTRDFQAGTHDSLTVFYDFFRKENYFSSPVLGLVESLRKQQRGLMNHVIYQMNDHTQLTFQTSFLLSNVEIARLQGGQTKNSRAHDDFNLANRVEIGTHHEHLDYFLGLDFGETTVNYRASDTSGFSPFSRQFANLGYDVNEKWTRISQRLNFTPWRRDVFRVFLELAKSQHDNSDTVTPDSYDEQRWQWAVAHVHRIDPVFSLAWEVSGFLKHFVYLDASYSGQNNWTRLLQLQPSIAISPGKRIQFRQKVGVRAQYVDFDFSENQNVSSSYVVRDFYLADSLALPVSQRIDATINYRFEIEELGSLQWSEFSSSPRTLWHTHWLNLKFRQNAPWPIRLSAGAIFYQQTRWQYQNNAEGSLERKKAGVHVNIGPVLEISFLATNGSVIYFSGQRQRTFPISGKSYYINNFHLSVQWTF